MGGKNGFGEWYNKTSIFENGDLHVEILRTWYIGSGELGIWMNMGAPRLLVGGCTSGDVYWTRQKFQDQRCETCSMIVPADDGTEESPFRRQKHLEQSSPNKNWKRFSHLNGLFILLCAYTAWWVSIIHGWKTRPGTASSHHISISTL